MSIGNKSFVLQEGLPKNNYFTYLPTNLDNAKIELKLATSEGPITIAFVIKNGNNGSINPNSIWTAVNVHTRFFITHFNNSFSKVCPFLRD